DKDYNECIDKYSDGVFAFLVKNMKDEQSAKDVLQDSFVSLWNNRLKVEKEKAKSFLFTSAHNFMINVFKYNTIRQRPLEREELFEEKNFENKNLIDYLTGFLSDNMKQCLLLRDLEGFSYKEIAQILGLTEENVKVNIFRARVKLRECLSKAEKH
ncbi:MAG: RNA polymerase sigma factor, partial [Bacteroidales bacterium]|nr:RNA polymerase sigma factor [Bacteroidales bacterium]